MQKKDQKLGNKTANKETKRAGEKDRRKKQQQVQILAFAYA